MKKCLLLQEKLHINNFSCIMANVIKIKKGLDINLKGKASDVLLNGGKSESYAIVPIIITVFSLKLLRSRRKSQSRFCTDD